MRRGDMKGCSLQKHCLENCECLRRGSLVHRHRPVVAHAKPADLCRSIERAKTVLSGGIVPGVPPAAAAAAAAVAAGPATLDATGRVTSF